MRMLYVYDRLQLHLILYQVSVTCILSSELHNNCTGQLFELGIWERILSDQKKLQQQLHPGLALAF